MDGHDLGASVLVGYGRVSSVDQDLRLQVDALIAAGVHPDNIHTDKLSGTLDKRPGFVAAMKDCREGDTLVVWKLDRISRRLVPLLQTLEVLERRGIGLKVLTEPIDTGTAVGRLMLHVLASFAQFERDLGVERTKAGLLAAKARGRVGGTQPKYGPERYAEAERLMREQGLSGRAAAEAIKVSPSTLYRHLGRQADAEGASDLG